MTILIIGGIVRFSGPFFLDLVQEDVYHGFISVLDEVILPALSFMQCNCGMAEEVWSVLKLLPYQTRCEYLTGSYTTHCVMQTVFPLPPSQ